MQNQQQQLAFNFSHTSPSRTRADYAALDALVAQATLLDLRLMQAEIARDRINDKIHKISQQLTSIESTIAVFRKKQ